jgi:hypothetical protein
MNRLSRAIAETPHGRMVNELRPAIGVICEHAYVSRAQRRHARTSTGAVVNVPKARQAPGLNEPYRNRKPVVP